jgi:hypothetical protein
MHELYKLLGIKLAMSTAYHPQTDRQTECVNQVLEGYLRIFTSQQQDDWDDYLPTGEFQYNNMVHSLTQQTPFMVDTGRHPHMGFEPQQPRSTLESANEFAERIVLGIEEAKRHLQRRKMSTPCTTTDDVSLPRYSHQETESGWMEVTLPPTDHRLSCHTDT